MSSELRSVQQKECVMVLLHRILCLVSHPIVVVVVPSESMGGRL